MRKDTRESGEKVGEEDEIGRGGGRDREGEEEVGGGGDGSTIECEAKS